MRRRSVSSVPKRSGPSSASPTARSVRPCVICRSSDAGYPVQSADVPAVAVLAGFPLDGCVRCARCVRQRTCMGGRPATTGPLDGPCRAGAARPEQRRWAARPRQRGHVSCTQQRRWAARPRWRRHTTRLDPSSRRCARRRCGDAASTPARARRASAARERARPHRRAARDGAAAQRPAARRPAG
jgi:hypothetical protein